MLTFFPLNRILINNSLTHTHQAIEVIFFLFILNDCVYHFVISPDSHSRLSEHEIAQTILAARSVTNLTQMIAEHLRLITLELDADTEFILIMHLGYVVGLALKVESAYFACKSLQNIQ